MALTLLQAGASIQHNVHAILEEDESYLNKKKPYKWDAASVERKKPLPKALPSYIVRNEWQGVIYVVLDTLDQRPQEVKNFIRV